AVGRGQAAAQVHLEAGGVAVEQLALETDVGGLDAGAAVGATVEVDGHRRLQRCVVGKPALQLVDQLGGRVLGVDKGELAGLDAGAGQGRGVEGAGAGVETDGGEPVAYRLGPVPRDVQNEDALVGGEPDALRAHGFGEVGHPGQDVAAGPADRGGGAHEVAAV